MSVGDLGESGGWRQAWAASFRGQSIDLGSVSGVAGGWRQQGGSLRGGVGAGTDHGSVIVIGAW
jgi:hypothetical protein